MNEPGEDKAGEFSELYETSYKTIFNYLLCGTTDVEVALDLTSETFFKAFRAWPRFEDRGVPAEAWLFKIAKHELAMHYRRQGRLRRFIAPARFDEEAGSVRRSVVEEEVDAARRELESREELIDLSPMIRGLPSKYRDVIFLRYFMDMPLGEISRLLSRPVGTVKSNLHRALKKLRVEMEPDDGPGHCKNREKEKVTDDPLLTEEVE